MVPLKSANSEVFKPKTQALLSTSWGCPTLEGLQTWHYCSGNSSICTSPLLAGLATLKGSHMQAQFHLSSGESTWKVLSMTVVHCRQRMTKVLGRGLSVFISWHSVMGKETVGRELSLQPAVPKQIPMC